MVYLPRAGQNFPVLDHGPVTVDEKSKVYPCLRERLVGTIYFFKVLFWFFLNNTPIWDLGVNLGIDWLLVLNH
jgi:hypothetical protein